jgi:hypothetical protein
MATVSVLPSRLSGHVGWNQLEDLGVDIEAAEIHRRHAVLAGENLGDLELGHEAHLHQHIAQPMLARPLFRHGGGELLASQHALTQENIAEPVGPDWCSRHDLAVSGRLRVDRGNVDDRTRA